MISEKIIKKDVDEYIIEEEELMNMALRAEMVLTSAKIENEYKRVSNYKNAKEIWKKVNYNLRRYQSHKRDEERYSYSRV